MNSFAYDDPESIRALLTRCGLRQHSTAATHHDHVEFEKQRALQDLQHQHDREMEDLFNYLEAELSKAGKAYNHKIALLQVELEKSNEDRSTVDRMYSNKIARLEEQLEKSHSDISDVNDMYRHKMSLLQERLESDVSDVDEMYRHKMSLLQERLDNSHVESVKRQEELKRREQQVSSDLRAAKNELHSSLQKNSALESEVAMLRRKLKEQQEEMVKKRRQYLGEIESKNKQVSALREELRKHQRSDGSVLYKKEEIRKLNRKAIMTQDEEIQKLKSESLRSVKNSAQGTLNTIKIDNSRKWEVESELTHENEFGMHRGMHHNENKKWHEQFTIEKTSSPSPIKQAPLSTRSNKLSSPMNLLGEEISMSYSSSHDENDGNYDNEMNIWSENLRKDMNYSLSKRLESMYCKK